MKTLLTKNRWVSIACLWLPLALLGACGQQGGEKAETAKPVMAPAPVYSDGAQIPATVGEKRAEAGTASTQEGKASPSKSAVDDTIAVEVDGRKLTKAQLDRDVNQKLGELKGQVPNDQLQQAKTELRKVQIDDFVVKTLLSNEIAKRKISADEKEVNDVIEAMKAQLPPGMTMDGLLKKNQIDLPKMREEIAMNIRINKLVLQELGGKVTVSDKETTDFYNKNLNRFKQPESVHARHLLIAFNPGDAEKVKAEKKAKAEALHKQLLGGADFASLAAKNSDCPSKQNGGDLGTFTRGQMVKAFEDAAFSQKEQVIGPVVETEFGYHIIQVLEHKPEQTTKLDKELRKQIAAYLENQKQQEAFLGLIKKMKANANIVVYGK